MAALGKRVKSSQIQVPFSVQQTILPSVIIQVEADSIAHLPVMLHSEKLSECPVGLFKGTQFL